MNDLEVRIAQETARRMRPLNLKQAHALLRHARNDLSMAWHALNDELAGNLALRDRVERVKDNEIEGIMWALETAIRQEPKP